MMVAMVLPSALPTFLKTRRAPVSLSVMATGYFAVWVASGTNLCARCRIRSGGHALGSFQPRRPCVVRRVVDCCRGLSIHKLENHRAAPLPFAIRVRKCLPGTRNQLPPWLQARHGLLPLLRRPDNDSAKAGSEQLSQSCEEFPLIPRAPSAEKIESPIRLRLTYFSPVGKTQAFYSCKNNPFAN